MGTSITVIKGEQKNNDTFVINIPEGYYAHDVIATLKKTIKPGIAVYEQSNHKQNNISGSVNVSLTDKSDQLQPTYNWVDDLVTFQGHGSVLVRPADGASGYQNVFTPVMVAGRYRKGTTLDLSATCPFNQEGADLRAIIGNKVEVKAIPPNTHAYIVAGTISYQREYYVNANNTHSPSLYLGSDLILSHTGWLQNPVSTSDFEFTEGDNVFKVGLPSPSYTVDVEIEYILSPLAQKALGYQMIV